MRHIKESLAGAVIAAVLFMIFNSVGEPRQEAKPPCLRDYPKSDGSGTRSIPRNIGACKVFP